MPASPPPAPSERSERLKGEARSGHVALIAAYDYEVAEQIRRAFFRLPEEPLDGPLRRAAQLVAEARHQGALEAAPSPPAEAPQEAMRQACLVAVLEQRCERGTPWDDALLAAAEAIRALPSSAPPAASEAVPWNGDPNTWNGDLDAVAVNTEMERERKQKDALEAFYFGEHPSDIVIKPMFVGDDSAKGHEGDLDGYRTAAPHPARSAPSAEASVERLVKLLGRVLVVLQYSRDHYGLRGEIRAALSAFGAAEASVERANRYKAALDWALGTNGEFRERKMGDGAYWWRRELRERAGLIWNGTESVDGGAAEGGER